MCFIFVPVSLFDMPHLQVNLYRKKRIYLPVFEVPASMCARCNIFPSMVPHCHMCRTVLLSVQHIDMNIQHQCTNRVTGNSLEWICEKSRLQNKL